MPAVLIRPGAVLQANYLTSKGRVKSEVQVVGCNHRGENPCFQIRVRRHIEARASGDLSLKLTDGNYEGKVSEGSAIYVPSGLFNSGRYFSQPFTALHTDALGREAVYEARASDMKGKGKALVRLVKRLN